MKRWSVPSEAPPPPTGGQEAFPANAAYVVDPEEVVRGHLEERDDEETPELLAGTM